MCVEQLANTVKNYMHRTGEDSLLVAVHGEGEQLNGVHSVGYEEGIGLLVDGWPASLQFMHELEGFEPLQQPPSVLH